MKENTEWMKDGKKCSEMLSSGCYVANAFMNSVAMVTYTRPIQCQVSRNFITGREVALYTSTFTEELLDIFRWRESYSIVNYS